MAHLKKKTCSQSAIHTGQHGKISTSTRQREKNRQKSSQQESKVAKQSINELKYFQIYSQNQKE